VLGSRELFANAHIPCFRTPEAATDAVDFLYRYLLSQQQLLQLPNPASRHTRADSHSAKELITSELNNNARVLGPQKTRALLAMFDIDVLPAHRAENVTDALAFAEKIKYPVAMKLVSPNIRYKAEIARTRLNVQDANELRITFSAMQSELATKRPEAEFRGILIESMYMQSNARALAVSISRDATFGPVISVGIGGDLSSLVQERAVQLPPLNNFLAESMLSTPVIANYLGNFRHQKPVEPGGAIHVLRRLSEMACVISIR